MNTLNGKRTTLRSLDEWSLLMNRTVSIKRIPKHNQVSVQLLKDERGQEVRV